MPGLQQRFASERELRERAHQGGRVVGVVGHERNLTRTRVRLKGSRPEVTKSSHMAAAPVVWWCVPMSAPARPGARVRMRRPGVMGPRGGGVYLPEVQRTRLLDATFVLVAREGYRERSSCKSNAVSRVSVGQHKLVRARGNREVSEVAEITDQGQISRLLRRLENHGLLENAGGETQGILNAWQLTDKGRQLTQMFRAHAQQQGGRVVMRIKRSNAGVRACALLSFVMLSALALTPTSAQALTNPERAYEMVSPVYKDGAGWYPTYSGLGATRLLWRPMVKVLRLARRVRLRVLLRAAVCRSTIWRGVPRRGGPRCRCCRPPRSCQFYSRWKYRRRSNRSWSLVKKDQTLKTPLSPAPKKLFST